MRIQARLRVAALAGAAAVAIATAVAGQAALPTVIRGGDTVYGEISPAGDVDEYEMVLFPGDTITVKVRNQGAIKGLTPTLTIRTPSGALPSATKNNGTRSPLLTFKAYEPGTHLVRIVGAPGEFTGSVGGYYAQIAVKRAATPKGGPFSFAEGGSISYRFAATAGARVDLKASTKKGGFTLGDLVRPDSTPEPGFAAAVKPAANRRSAAVKKYAVTGGDGEYELKGTYDAGSSVTITAKVTHLQTPRKRMLGDEPKFDTVFPPFPDQGVPGTVISIPGTGFSYVDVPDGEGEDVYPRFWLGSAEIPRAAVTRPNASLYQIAAPQGLVPRQAYDITVENADGQRVVLEDAFTVIPPPVIASVAAIDGGPVLAGPAGGRRLRLTGSEFRAGSIVLFGSIPQQPSVVLPGRIDVTAPPHAAGVVTISLRDQFGQIATAPSPFTYADVPSNSITSIDLTFVQALGGETVTVTGTGFSSDPGATQGATALTFDGAAVPANVTAATTLTFTVPQHEASTVQLRVADRLEQTSSRSVEIRGFADQSAFYVPAPVSTTGQADGWRATRILRADLNGDTRQDLVLLQSGKAAGNSAGRSRVRVLLANSNGSFQDITSSAMPAVSGDEDWRAKDGVIDDFDADGKPDLAIVTDDDVSSGSRSSLRVLKGSGTGTFTDKTSDWLPAVTTWGEKNQGSAVVSMRVDANSSPDLVVGHNAYFTQTVLTQTDPGDLSQHIPPTYRTDYYYYPGTRVFSNGGDGTFTRTYAPMPAVSPSSEQQYQAETLLAADYDQDGKTDLFLTRSGVTTYAGSAYRTLRLMRNTGGSFTDVSAAALPTPTDPDYLQAARLVALDLQGNGYPSVVLASPELLSNPLTGATSSGLSLRLLVNSNGTLAMASAGTIPDPGTADRLQCDDLTTGDLDGDGNTDIVLVSKLATVYGARACRILRRSGSAFADASLGMPAPAAGDDGRGEAVVLSDLAGDGDMDVILTRNEPDETVKNLRLFFNPRH